MKIINMFLKKEKEKGKLKFTKNKKTKKYIITRIDIKGIKFSYKLYIKIYKFIY